jgi:hypothetical protein
MVKWGERRYNRSIEAHVAASWGSYTDAAAALSWAPTRAWPPGEIIRVETPILAIGHDLGVLVGISPPGARPDDPAKRLSPTMAAVSAAGDAPPKIIPEAGLAELFRFER